MNRRRILIAGKGIYHEITPRVFRAAKHSKELTRQGYDMHILLRTGEKDCFLFRIGNNNLELKSLSLL